MRNFIRYCGLLVPALLLFSEQSHAQDWKLDLKASVTYQLIPSVETNTSTKINKPASTGYSVMGINYAFTETFSVHPGAKLQTCLEYSFGEKIFAGAGLGLQYVNFRRSIRYDFPAIVYDTTLGITWNDPTANGHFQSSLANSNSGNTGKTSILYVDIPFYAGYHLPGWKVSASLGLNMSLITWSQQYRQMASFNGSGILITEVEDHSGKGLNHPDFSLFTRFSYHPGGGFQIFGSYSFPLNPVFTDSNQYAGKARRHLLELGLGFRLR